MNDKQDGAAWTDYLDNFVQRIPRYAVKRPGGLWRTKPGPLTDRPIRAHLEGAYSVAVLGQAYPLFAVLDIDDRGRDEVERIRGALGLDSSSSMLTESESANSYHVIIRPEYNGRPPSIRLLGELFREFARSNRVEVYPQWRHAVRLPFGPKQRPADPEYRGLSTWEDAVYWFGKLDEFDLKSVRFAQGELNVPIIGARPSVPSIAPAVGDLLAHGLQAPGTRHEAQFVLLMMLWRRNVPQEEAERVVWNWISRRHNGMSRDILRHPQAVRKEITRQATAIWGRFDFGRVLPDTPALAHEGYITRPDILEIIRATKGNLPRSRFLHGLVRFVNPRRYRMSVGVSTERLIAWASRRSYGRYLAELAAAGIVRRGRAYQVGLFSKSIRLAWPFQSSQNAVCFDGRAVETFDGACQMVLRPDEFRQALEAQGRDRKRAHEAVRAVYRGGLRAEILDIGAPRSEDFKSASEEPEERH